MSSTKVNPAPTCIVCGDKFILTTGSVTEVKVIDSREVKETQGLKDIHQCSQCREEHGTIITIWQRKDKPPVGHVFPDRHKVITLKGFKEESLVT